MRPYPADHSHSGNTPVSILVCCLAVLCIPSVTLGQSVSISAPDPKRWDATGSIGWFAGNQSEIAEDWNDWYDTFSTSFDVGRYWTPHLKTEAGVLFTTEGRVFSHEERAIPGGPSPIFIPREHHFRVTGVSTAVSYQFFENTWVHPFLTAGAQFTEERERAFSQAVPFFNRDLSRIDLSVPAPRQATVFSVRPFAMGGAKFYVNERAFVRTDLGVGWNADGVAQVSWRAGIGVDF